MEVLTGVIGTALLGSMAYLIKLVHAINLRLVRVETLLNLEGKWKS